MESIVIRVLDEFRERPNPFVVPPHATIACPIQTSMGVFGRKWALVVFRDVVFMKNPRYTDILRSNKGLTPRVLTWRLKELEEEGIIERRAGADNREVRYELTPTGRDAIPILTAMIYFGSKRRAAQVFPDGRPRTMTQLFPTSQRELLQGLAEWAKR